MDNITSYEPENINGKMDMVDNLHGNNNCIDTDINDMDKKDFESVEDCENNMDSGALDKKDSDSIDGCENSKDNNGALNKRDPDSIDDCETNMDSGTLDKKDPHSVDDCEHNMDSGTLDKKDSDTADDCENNKGNNGAFNERKIDAYHETQFKEDINIDEDAMDYVDLYYSSDNNEVTEKRDTSNMNGLIDNIVMDSETSTPEDGDRDDGSQCDSGSRSHHGKEDEPNTNNGFPQTDQSEESRSKRASVNSLTSQGLSSLTSVNGGDEKRKKVGNYLLDGMLGQGSYAKVYMSTHLPTRHKVAVKAVTKRSLVLRDAVRHHFRREALLLPKLSHPNVVRLYEAMETSNAYYLVFELAGGGHLLGLVSQKGNLTEEESRVYMKQITSAIDHLHQSGIVHRDIKLENIMLDDRNNVKLVDFGFSTVCHMSDLNTQCGCPLYAAPEVFAGRKYGRSVDIWSLGVCFYGMLLGRLPFLPVTNSLSQLFTIILKGCMIPSHLTLSCQNLLSRMLDLQEGRRITIDEILLHHWLTFPDGHPIKRYRPVPKRLHESVVRGNQHILKYMCTTFRFSETEIVNSVVERRLNSSAATYHILRERMENSKWREQTAKASKTLEKLNMARNQLSSSGSSPSNNNTTADINTISKSHSVEDVENVEMSDNVISDGDIISPKPGLSSNQNKANKQADKSVSPEDYKSYILVLKQSRLCAKNEPAILSNSKKQTTHQLYFDLIRRSPPYVALDSPCTSADPSPSSALPSIFKSDTTATVKRLMRINPSQAVGLGVMGTSPLIHDRVGDPDYKTPVSPSKHFAANTSLTAHLRAFSRRIQPPPPPPNSSLGGHFVDLQTQEARQYKRQMSASPWMLIQNRNSVASSESPPSSGKDIITPIRPSLSSLRESFATDIWGPSRTNPRLRVPRPTVSILRRKKKESPSAEIRVQGKSTKYRFDGDRDGMAPLRGHMTWTEKNDLATNFGYDDDDDDDDDVGNRDEDGGKDAMLQGMADYLNSVTGTNGYSEEDQDKINSVNTQMDKLPRTVTFASFPSQQTVKTEDGFPLHVSNGMVKTISIHTNSNSQHDSSHSYRQGAESRQSQNQSMDREDFLTPVTRVTITTIGKNS